MLESVGSTNLEQLVQLANDPAAAAERLQQLQDELATSDERLRDRKLSLRPQFITVRQRRILESSGKAILEGLEAFLKRWLKDEEMQAEWGVTAEEIALYKVDPGYEGTVQIGRLDGLLNRYDLQYLEFNCDSPGGNAVQSAVQDAYWNTLRRQIPTMAKASPSFKLAATIKNVYADWRRNHPERPKKPVVAITEWGELLDGIDYKLCKANLEASGLTCHILAPEQMEARDDGLYHQNERIDVVYKRVITKDFALKPEGASLRAAYEAGHVCLLNPPRAAILGNKRVLSYLRRPDVFKELPAEGQEAIRKYIPWTEVLRDEKVEFKGYTVDLAQFVEDNKDHLVLKATQSLGGKDVFLGFETPQREWSDLIKRELHSNAWVVQELVQIPKEAFPEPGEDGEVAMKLLRLNINPVVFNGKVTGAYTRLATKNVINVSTGAWTTPTFTLRRASA